MKVLLITDEVWNDSIHGNNVLSNWLEGFSGEFAQIYASPGVPENNCCNKYFQITDKMMIDSLLKGKRAGRILSNDEISVGSGVTYNSTDVQGIGFMRKYFGNFLRLFKSFVWKFGKYDELKLKEFIEDFSPDIIFSPRFANIKMLRLEKKALEYAKCPIVAFTGDNEYSLKRFSLSPVFWINAFGKRIALRHMINKYSLYYTLSAEQKEEYEKAFCNEMKILMKCGEFSDEYKSKSVNKPIRIVYAGKLYMKRWKTLAKIGEALKKINSDSVKMVLDIYTRDKVTKNQAVRLNDGKNVFLKGSAAPEELVQIYNDADIALHVESFSLHSRYATRVSFSTKIIDCLASSCAVMAVAWKEHSGITYLQREDAAICISDLNGIYDVLSGICKRPDVIEEYRRKAWECGVKNHRRTDVQKMLYDDFKRIINKSKTN